MKKYWIHALESTRGYLFLNKTNNSISFDKKGVNTNEIQKIFTLEQVDALQETHKELQNIELRKCLESIYENEYRDFCTVLFQDYIDGEPKFHLKNVYIYDDNRILFTTEYLKEPHKTYADYIIVKRWRKASDFDFDILKEIIETNKSKFAPNGEEIYYNRKRLEDSSKL